MFTAQFVRVKELLVQKLIEIVCKFARFEIAAGDFLLMSKQNLHALGGYCFFFITQ